MRRKIKKKYHGLLTWSKTHVIYGVIVPAIPHEMYSFLCWF